MNKGLLLIFLLGMLIGCEETPVPKPHGQLRLEYPKAAYTAFAPEDCPFSFDISTQAQVLKGSKPCVFNVTYPGMKAKIFLSYTPVSANLETLQAETERIIFQHTVKASGIKSKTFSYPEKNVFGQYYTLEGEAASNIQFYATDSTRHFLSGSLYFKTRPNPDSLAPAITYIENDIRHMLDTFVWKN